MATDVLLAKVGLFRPAPLRTLSPPYHLGSRRSSPVDHVEARSLLASQRQAQYASSTTSIEHTTPSTRLRSVLSIKRLTPHQEPDQSTWVFNDHEVASVIDNLLDEEPLRSVGVAQAVLLHATDSSLDRLWFSRQGAEPRHQVQWLNNVTSRGNLDYIKMICEMGPTIQVLSAAFRLAFDQGSLDAMELLLSYGADASTCKAGIRECMRSDHMDFVRLLLAAPRALTDAFWQACLNPCEKVAPAVLLQCLSHRPTLASEWMLEQALNAQDLRTTAVLLAYTSLAELTLYDHEFACCIVSRIDDSTRRCAFFDLLHEAELLSDNSVLRDEMMRDVKNREMPLVYLLVKAGVALDVPSANALKWAIVNMDLQMVDALCTGALNNAAEALDWIPQHASERDIIKLLSTMATLDLSGVPLHRRLIAAVRRQHTSEAKRLLQLGASVDFEEASAIRITILQRNFALFNLLMQGHCSPKNASSLIPALVELEDRHKRFAAIEKVLSKGALPESLGSSLEALLTEAEEADSACIQLLLRYGASPDASDEETTNSVLVATRRGQLGVLKAMCGAVIRPQILSSAVLIAFREFSSGTYGHDATLETIHLLLTKGAKGTPVDQALLSAVKQGSCINIVKLLLSFGADPNYTQGEAFVRALSTKSSDTFGTLCERCQPNLASTERLMSLAIDQRYYEPKTLETLLKYTLEKRAALDAVTAESLRRNSNMTAIFRCLLRHGLNINSDACKFLSLAVFAEDVSLLRDMLAARPNETSLQIAFKVAVGIRVKQTKIKIMTLLLEQAAGAEIGQTDCIQHQTQLAIGGELEGLQLILHYGARVDHQEGIAFQVAAAAGNLQVLQLLSVCQPTVETIKHVCLVSLKSLAGREDISPNRKYAIYEALLDASASTQAEGSYMSDLLHATVQRMPAETQFPALLLARGAQIDGRTIEVALEKAEDNLLALLTSRTQKPLLFQLVSTSKMSEQRRLSSLKDLLKQEVHHRDKSRALLHALDSDRIHDLRSAALLLKHGADTSFQNGEAFKLAIKSGSVLAVRLLSARSKTPELANITFLCALEATFEDARTRFEIYQCLLDESLVHKRNCYSALYMCLDRHGADLDTIRLLLKKGAEPNAACFISACRLSTTEQFRELCKQANLDLIVQMLLSNFDNEGDAAKWLKLCLKEQPRSAKITNSDLLYECIRRYPNGEEVVALILKRSVAVNATVSFSILPGWAKERCSLLIWALLATPKVSNRTILRLLEADIIDIEHETATTQISAALTCILDSARTPVLKALLRLRTDILEHQVPVFGLAHMGAYPAHVTPEQTHDLGTPSLRMASLYLGNIDAFKILDDGIPLEDSLLHLAALLALPKFVKELLNSHNPNLESEDYENYTPLAVAIETTIGPPWCKVANAEAPFAQRRKEAIRLLAQHVDLSWRFRKKTYVHLALHVDFETIETLLNALDISTRADRFERLVYEDKAGRRYTPCEYVRELMGIKVEEQRELLRCLAKSNLLTGPENATFNASR